MTNSRVFERGGCVVRPGRRLGEIVHRRPPGITGHQWTTASRTRLDFVACDAVTGAPAFAVVFDNQDASAAECRRTGRMTDAVCGAVGLGVLRVGSSALRADQHGRRIVEYVLDARAFAEATRDHDERDGAAEHAVDDASDDRPPNYREIIGRLPDGRSGFVNDLGALARAAAIDAYASRLLIDPILRGLHALWPDGSAEGWAWLDVREGQCLFERVLLHPRGLACGVDPARLAEDLAAMAVGERLKTLDTAEPPLLDRCVLRREVNTLRQRRTEAAELSDIDHISL